MRTIGSAVLAASIFAAGSAYAAEPARSGIPVLPLAPQPNAPSEVARPSAVAGAVFYRSFDKTKRFPTFGILHPMLGGTLPKGNWQVFATAVVAPDDDGNLNAGQCAIAIDKTTILSTETGSLGAVTDVHGSRLLLLAPLSLSMKVTVTNTAGSYVGLYCGVAYPYTDGASSFPGAYSGTLTAMPVPGFR